MHYHHFLTKIFISLPRRRDLKEIFPVSKILVCNNQKGINCDLCLFWYQVKCVHINNSSCVSLSNSNENRLCIYCVHQIWPYCNLTDNKFFSMLDFKLTETIFPINLANPQYTLFCSHKFASIMDGLNFIGINHDIPISFYITVDKFNLFCDQKIKFNELLCMHLYFQNLISKFDGILKLLDSILAGPDVLAVTETWVKAEMLSCANINGFTFFNKSHGD